MQNFFLPANGALDPENIVVSLMAHAIPGIDHLNSQDKELSRVFSTPHGNILTKLRFTTLGIHVEILRASGDYSAATVSALANIISRIFDLDTDLAPIQQHFLNDKFIGPLIHSHKNIRLIGYSDPFEALTMIVLGQQVSLAAGRTFGGRLVAAYAEQFHDKFYSFPTAQKLMAVSTENLRQTIGLTGARARTLSALAKIFSEHETRDFGTNSSDTRKLLHSIPGIGPWTMTVYALRMFREMDAFPSSDLVLLRTLNLTHADEAEALSNSWRPYRAYALMHLWSNSAYSTIKIL